MRWRRASGWHLEADSGHKVSRARVRDAWRYSAWSPDGALSGIFDTDTEAKRRCEDSEQERE